MKHENLKVDNIWVDTIGFEENSLGPEIALAKVHILWSMSSSDKAGLVVGKIRGRQIFGSHNRCFDKFLFHGRQLLPVVTTLY